MNELYIKIEELKSCLEKEEKVKKLKKKLNKIKEREELINLIEKYHENPSKKIESEINQDPDILEYRHLETEVNLLILEIRSKLKKIVGKKEKSENN